MTGQIDFGYPWWLSYGHLVVLGVAGALLFLARTRRWSRLLVVLFSVLTLWSAAAFVATRFVLEPNERASLPTEAFLASGAGRVLDIGAGTGRSTLMVLEARPRTTMVAVDLFGDSFVRHFGPGKSPVERLRANLKAAGVEDRVTIETADMRALPFEPAAFDAIVSAYAMDHVNREGSRKSLSEAARVLKPGGEFLLMIVGKDPWLKFTFGPLLVHSGTRGVEWWTGRLQDAGFQVVEQGIRPMTFYWLARKR